MILPNTPMVKQQLRDVLDAVAANALAGKGPYEIFDPYAFSEYFDLRPPYTVTDRGAYDPAHGPYQAGDKVDFNGLKFISVVNDNAAPPLDENNKPTGVGRWQQPWLDALRRARNDLGRVVNQGGTGISLSPWEQCVSGPWPCNNPDINFDLLSFYYADTGRSESVAIAGTGGGGMFGKVVSAFETDLPLQLFDSIFNPQFARMPSDEVDNGNFPDPGTSATLTATTGPPPQFRFRITEEAQLAVVVGGTQPIHVDGYFAINVAAYQGWTFKQYAVHTPAGDEVDSVIDYDPTDPLTLLSVDLSNWPFGAFTQTFSGWQANQLPHGMMVGTIQLRCEFHGTAAPGVYGVGLKYTGDPANYAAGQIIIAINADGSTSINGSMEWGFKTILGIDRGMSILGTASFTATNAVETPGIHNTKRVMRIDMPRFHQDVKIPSGVFGEGAIYQATDPPATVPGDPTQLLFFNPGQRGFYPIPPVWQVDENNPNQKYVEFVKDTFLGELVPGSFTESTTGFWTGKTPPINDLHMIPFGKMPWNIFPTTLPRTSPKKATDNLYLGYTLPHTGDPIVTNSDAVPAYNLLDLPAYMGGNGINGEFETIPEPRRWKPNTKYPKGFVIMDSFGNFQVCTTEGRTGLHEPNWPHEEGEMTFEPDYPGLTGAAPGPAWRLFNKLRPTPNRKLNQAYPFGTAVIDDNGNEATSVEGWQKNHNYALGDELIDKNGNLQQVTSPGASGANEPAWSMALNATTADGAAVWTLVQNAAQPTSGPGDTAVPWATVLNGLAQDGTVFWKLTHINLKFSSPVPKISPPIYPYFWHNPHSDWQANHDYALNDSISDGVGNTQVVIQAGRSAGATPAWGTTFGARTDDGSVQWQLAKIGAPVLDDPNIDPNWPLGAAYQHPFSFHPEGWFIYRVALNRIPQVKSAEPPPTDPIPVQIGCVRNGQFVSFGTFNTGGIYDAMWPVFTNTPLAYRAQEMIDLQAEVLTCGLNFSTWGAMGYPLAAAHINDLYAILGILV